MDWPMESDGVAVQQAWSQSITNLLGGWILVWALAVTALLLLMLVAIRRVRRRRQFWCAEAACAVEVEFMEEEGVFGLQRPVAVCSCSVFAPPTEVRCARRCIHGEVRMPLTLKPSRAGRTP